MSERKCKIMQVNIQIYPEDEDKENIMDLIIDIITTANDRTICVDNAILDNKEIFNTRKGFSL